MDANYSNGSSVYHGLSVNLRKRFSRHYEFLASYTWSHAIDDSTDLQSTLTPQDSYYPGARPVDFACSTSAIVLFSAGFIRAEKSAVMDLPGKFLSDWTFAPLIEFGVRTAFQYHDGRLATIFSCRRLTGRPNTFVNPACTALGYAAVTSKFSPTGVFQEPCIADFQRHASICTDGNLGRNAGVTPWTVFNDLRVSKRIYFGERFNMELIADMFNIANRYNVAAVSPLFTNAGQATAAYDPRQFQFALKFYW